MTLPAEFITRTQMLLGNEYNAFEAALETESPVSIRINPEKNTPVPSEDKNFTPVPWSNTGYYLPERLSFTFDPLLHAGAYYVQEASSMFLEQAIRQYVKSPVIALDLCAAPGGKSTDLLSCLPEGSALISNEVIRSRSYILAENITKWGNPNSIVINNDPKEIGELTHLFDVIVTDVPCSGEGMFRKDPESRSEWSVENVQLCASRQRRIIHDIWSSLKPGGLLIYSTCTYNLEENEENIHYFCEELEAEALPVSVNPEWNIDGAKKYGYPVYHFYPHQTKGEGFFLAVLRKPEGEVNTIQLKKNKTKKGKGKNPEPIPHGVKEFILNHENGNFIWKENKIIFLTEVLSGIYPLLESTCKILTAGIEIGEQKGKDFIPAQALALSILLNKKTFASIDTDWDTAITFLRKEAISVPCDINKGYVLITYKNFPLGFVKHLGNRSNNLYPQEWRIRSGYNPEVLRTYL